MRVSGVYDYRQVAFLRNTPGGLKIRLVGANGTREGGKLVILAMKCARLREAKEG